MSARTAVLVKVDALGQFRVMTPLMPPAAEILQRALTALRSSAPVQAERHWQTLPADAKQHPDALFVYGLIARASGNLAAARQALGEAARLAPRQPQIWKALGDVCDDSGDSAAALAALSQATDLAPGYVEAWFLRGLVEERLAMLDEAERSFATLAIIAPGDARALAGQGRTAQARGDQERAVEHFRAAIAKSPTDLRSRHNLAIALRETGSPDAALDELDVAINAGLDQPQSLCLRAHLLADSGRFDEAVSGYQSLTEAVPDYCDAHETLARLLPQISGAADALATYRTALARRPGSRALWLSAIASAKAVGNADQMLDWAQQARAQLGAVPELAMAEIGAHILARNWLAAQGALEPLVREQPDFHPARLNLAHALLAQGNLQAAEDHALTASRLAPEDQGAWSLLSVIWRLRGDPREAWLADYERLVMPVDLKPPHGWSNRAEWLHAVRTALEALHITKRHPAEQSLRGGTQTRGLLFTSRDPIIQGLATAINDAVVGQIGHLSTDRDHPFLRRITGAIRFAGSWSVRLHSEGFHINHIHQSGWLSSACYIDLPPEIGGNENDHAGALQFGTPDAAFGLDLAPRRIETPRIGRLVVFPSYLWHGTLPFQSDTARLTVAFDALPA